LKNQGVDGRIGLDWIVWRLAGVVCGMDSPGSGWGPVAGCCECGDEPSGSGGTELVIYELNMNILFIVFTNFNKAIKWWNSWIKDYNLLLYM
jgi:hypothetical protein